MTKKDWIRRYLAVRGKTLSLCSSLEIEDFVVQPTEEVSPPKWHLGHTTWFFEEMILRKFLVGYQRFDDGFSLLFNSYYKAAGEHWVQGDRGQLSRPAVREIYEYRRVVDEQVVGFLEAGDVGDEVLSLLETGLHHEQQHQELLVMDIKVIFAVNPCLPVYCTGERPKAVFSEHEWVSFGEGVADVGYGGSGFSYDNERPVHKHYLRDFSVRKQVVTNGEFLAFIRDGGYENPRFWLSQGWDWVRENRVSHPLYWRLKSGEWQEFTLYGVQALDLEAPVVHVSYFEAEAFAAWSGNRLLTEQEFEVFLRGESWDGERGDEVFHPFDAGDSMNQVWGWTASPYTGYPGFEPFAGDIREYNGKFMCNQFVLRGGCVATPEGHIRETYRNFYLPHQRWCFSGIRLGKDGK